MTLIFIADSDSDTWWCLCFVSVPIEYLNMITRYTYSKKKIENYDEYIKEW